MSLQYLIVCHVWLILLKTHKTFYQAGFSASKPAKISPLDFFATNEMKDGGRWLGFWVTALQTEMPIDPQGLRVDFPLNIPWAHRKKTLLTAFEWYYPPPPPKISLLYHLFAAQRPQVGLSHFPRTRQKTKGGITVSQSEGKKHLDPHKVGP